MPRQSFSAKIANSKYNLIFALILGVAVAIAVSVGATSIGTNVDVTGNVTVAGNIAVNSSSATSTFAGGVSFAKDFALTNTATSSVTMANGLNFDNNTFVIDPNSGYVGVGTSSPAYKLDVNGSSSLASRFMRTSSNDSPVNIISLQALNSTGVGVTGSGASLQYQIQNSVGNLTEAAIIRALWEDATSSSEDSSISFWTRLNGTVAEKVRINNSGNIGIGTTTPNNKIDIYSTTKSAIGFSGASGDTYKWTMGMDVSNRGRFSIASSTALGTTDRFVIDGNGNIGIGTTSPASILHVSSGATATTTVEFGAQSINARTCFNVRDALGAATSFYFVGTTMIIEANYCR